MLLKTRSWDGERLGTVLFGVMSSSPRLFQHEERERETNGPTILSSLAVKLQRCGPQFFENWGSVKLL